MQIVMFTVGSVIFIAYMFGLLTMINRSHKSQEKDFPIKADEMDMDGMGNFSRFPMKQKRMEEFGYRKIYGNELKKYMKTKKKEKV